MDTTIETYMRRGRLSLNEATRVAELLTAGQGFAAIFEADGNPAGAAAIRAELVLSGELAAQFAEQRQRRHANWRWN